MWLNARYNILNIKDSIMYVSNIILLDEVAQIYIDNTDTDHASKKQSNFKNLIMIESYS